MVTELLKSTYAIMLMVRGPLCPWLIVLLAAALPEASAQDRKYEGMPVRNIQFEPRRQPLEASQLHDILPLRMNEPLRMADVRASIGRLFATGRYADIEVDARPYQDGVAILFITRNSWFVGAITVNGQLSNPPSGGQLENITDLNLGQPYTDSKLARAVAAQQRLLENNGLYRGNVHPVFDWETGKDYQQVNIRFEVDAGPRAHFGEPVLLGDLKMEPQRILTATKLRRWLINTWKPVTQLRVRQALEGVRDAYQKEHRLEAKVVLDSIQYDPESNRATPTLRIDAGPRINVRTIGYDISQRKLRRYIPIYEEHTVDHDLLVEGEHNLRNYLQSQGYFGADVQVKEQRVTNDRATIDYLINTGERHKLVAIRITGNRYFTTETIRERMYLQTVHFLQFPHGRYSGALLRRDQETIEDLYQSNGFRDVKVTSRAEDNYLGKKGEIAVLIDIQEGPQYSVGALDVEGVERMNKADLLSRLSSIPGQPFSDYNVAVDRDAILARYFESGFPKATFEWSSRPDAADPHRVDLRFTIHEGPQQFVRQVIVTGNKVTRDSFINRQLTLNPGDLLSPTAVTETQRRLYDLGVFSRVDAAIQDPDGDTEHKYVLYNVSEARRYSFAMGLGAQVTRIGGCSNCLESPGGSTGFAPRVSADITRNNLWGVGHSISLRTRASTVDDRALLNYSWPRFERREDLTVSFTGLFQYSNDIRTFTYRREEASAQLNQRLTKATTLFYRYAYRRVSISDLKISPFLIPQLSQPVRVGIASLNLVEDRRDDPVEPHKGIYNTVDVGVAERWFGSQPNFLRLLLRNATYHPIGKRFVLARNTEFGDLYGFGSHEDPLQSIPIAEHFFGGGGTSHRGFFEQQAGPRDTSTGFPLGGTALLFNQTELRFPLIGDNLGAVLFHDIGNIYSSLEKMSFRFSQRDIQDFDYAVQAVGFGIRYRTPVGPIRIDLGYSINPPNYYGVPKGFSEQDLINLGPNPCPPNVPNVCVAQRLPHFTYAFSIGQTF
jgi:outer membrane protein insertion porin family